MGAYTNVHTMTVTHTLTLSHIQSHNTLSLNHTSSPMHILAIIPDFSSNGSFPGQDIHNYYNIYTRKNDRLKKTTTHSFIQRVSLLCWLTPFTPAHTHTHTHTHMQL